MATIDDAVQAVVDIIDAVSGVREAPDYPGDSVPAPLTCYVYSPEAVWSWAEFGEVRPVGSIRAHLFYPHIDLARAIKALMPFADSIPKAILAKPTLSGKVIGFEGVRCRLEPTEWAGLGYAQIVFTIEGVEWNEQAV